MTFAPLDQLGDISTAYDAGDDDVRAGLIQVVSDRITQHPRSQQVAIGPSEIGTQCARCLARKLAGMRESGFDGVPWRPTVGTAVHTWLQDTFIDANPKDGPLRWLSEFRVSIGEIAGVEVCGTCDLYDRVTASVVDFKIMGLSSLRKLKKDGPRPEYRVQAHAYGRGYIRRRVHVERVAILGLPQNGQLSEAMWWSEPYDEQIVIDALARCETIRALIDKLGAATVIDQLPAADGCYSCPRYWGSTIPATAVAEACPGHPGSATRIT